VGIVPASGSPEDRILTVPNLLSLARLLGIPLFLWVVVVREEDVLGFIILVIAGATDWLDGYLARRWDQRTRLGVILDPLVDRLYIVAVLLGLALRELIPWWLVILLALRDVLLLLLLPSLKRQGRLALPVTYVGKAATFALLWGFPLLLLGQAALIGPVMSALGWAFAIWGAFLYWWAGVRYAQVALGRRAPEGARS
jgi:cardiolipin synthase (CMP-forming)